MHLALYRKWRPSAFDDVYGQEHVTSVLKSEVENGKLSHAYLFCGPRGTGKTTCAKIIAKAANCEHPVNGSPCGECASCKTIEAGATSDIVEMDAASNNGIEDIREIRDGIVYTPADLKYRVFIIDEVHMLSIQAFNALLKTLEEPPEHVIFILATTELQKIPATVLSRCQRFDFRRVTPEDIISRMKIVCDGENIKASDDALSLIAGMAQGSFRDALNLLEYCSGQSSEITADSAGELLGVSPVSLLSGMASFIAEYDTASALGKLEQIYMSSRDIAVFWREMISFFRDMLICASSSDKIQRSPACTECAAKYTVSRLIGVIDTFSSAETLMQRNPTSARLYAETAIVRVCERRLQTDTDELIKRIADLEERLDALCSGGFAVESGKQNIYIKEETAVKAPGKEADISRTDTPDETVKEKPKSPVAQVARTAQPAQTVPTAGEGMKLSKSDINEKASKKIGMTCLYRAKRWGDACERISIREVSIMPFIDSSEGFCGDDGRFYIFFSDSFAEELLTDARRREGVCEALNKFYSARFIPDDIKAITDSDDTREKLAIDELSDI